MLKENNSSYTERIHQTRSMCESCSYADRCSKLVPCDEFALAIGTNFNADVDIVYPTTVEMLAH